MKLEEVKSLPVKNRLEYWIREREAIRCKRLQRKEQPWTDDEILAKYKFCNVRRMDDRVSVWLYENWYKPYYDHENMLLACSLARYFNKPEALAEIGFPTRWQPAIIKRRMREMKAEGFRIFNGAYMIFGIGTDDKTGMVVDRIIQPLYDDKVQIYNTCMRASVAVLAERWGFNTFLAGQVVADLRWAMKGSWLDRMTYAPPGPGSRRGLNRFHSRPIDAPVPIEEFGEQLVEVIGYCKSNLPTKITNRLEAQDYQGCLCEFDKYERALWGQGRPKQLFKPFIVL